MSMTNINPDSTSGEPSSGVPPAPGAGTPEAVSTPSNNGGQPAEEIKNSNQAHPVPVEPPVVPATDATNISRSSSYVRQFFPGGGNSDWMKREKLDLDAVEKGA